MRAKAGLVRDLANSSGEPDQFQTAQVGPHLGSGYDGDALTFLSSDSGKQAGNWTVGSNGQALFPCQVSYYLIVPDSTVGLGFTPAAGAPDSSDYEQQDPAKWLVRRVEGPVPAANPQALLANWTSSLLSSPSSLNGSPTPLAPATSASQSLVATAPRLDYSDQCCSDPRCGAIDRPGFRSAGDEHLQRRGDIYRPGQQLIDFGSGCRKLRPRPSSKIRNRRYLVVNRGTGVKGELDKPTAPAVEKSTGDTG